MTSMKHHEREEGLRQVILRATQRRRERNADRQLGSETVDNVFAAGPEESTRVQEFAPGLLGPASRHPFAGGSAHA